MNVQVPCPVCGDLWTYEVVEYEPPPGFGYLETRYGAALEWKNCGCQLTDVADSPEEDAALDRMADLAIEQARRVA